MSKTKSSISPEALIVPSTRAPMLMAVPVSGGIGVLLLNTTVKA